MEELMGTWPQYSEDKQAIAMVKGRREDEDERNVELAKLNIYKQYVEDKKAHEEEQGQRAMETKPMRSEHVDKLKKMKQLERKKRHEELKSIL